MTPLFAALAALLSHVAAYGQIQESGYTAAPPQPRPAPQPSYNPAPPPPKPAPAYPAPAPQPAYPAPAPSYGPAPVQTGYGGGGGSYTNDYKNRPLDNGYGMRKVEPATVNLGRQLTYQQWCAEQTEPCPSEEEFEQSGYGQSYGNANSAPQAAPYGPAPAPAPAYPAPAPQPAYPAPAPAPQPSYPAPAPAPAGYVNKVLNKKEAVESVVREEPVGPLVSTTPSLPTSLLPRARRGKGKGKGRRRRFGGKGRRRRFGGKGKGKGRRRPHRRGPLLPRRKSLKL